MESYSLEREPMKGNRQRAPAPIRLPDDLKQWLKHKAVDNYRSFNGEIVARLEKSRADELKQEAQQ